MSSPFPAAPPPPEHWQSGAGPEASLAAGWRHAPDHLRPVVVLLAVNLCLSIVLTLMTVVLRHSIVSFQLDHRHISDPQQRSQLRDGYTAAIIGRVIGNIVISVVYVFLVRALLRGRRWAYRRVIWLGGAGIVGLILIQLSPYPMWMRAEQLVQAVVLGLLLYFVTRPMVRAHFAPHLPGRVTKRFGR